MQRTTVNYMHLQYRRKSLDTPFDSVFLFLNLISFMHCKHLQAMYGLFEQERVSWNDVSDDLAFTIT